MRDAPVRGCMFIKLENDTSSLHLPASQRRVFKQMKVMGRAGGGKGEEEEGRERETAELGRMFP